MLHVRSRATAFSLTLRLRRRLTHCIVFEKILSRERVVPLVLAGRVILPAAPALTDAQKETALHAFKVRCVPGLCMTGLRALTPAQRCLKNCFWLLMLLYPGVCKKARHNVLV